MKSIGRWSLWVVLAGLALQLFFLARIALMLVVDPQSTAFQRSEVWQVARAWATTDKSWRWRQEWVDYDAISPYLKRAVIASEDGGFIEHGGVDWGAVESAWQKNERRQQAADARAERLAAQQAKRKTPTADPAVAPTTKAPKIIGGSTITQQLAKNLLLSGERNLLRKGQELVLTLMIEAVLDKPRILAIYLNSVEWGEGIFGAEAAAQTYFKKPAAKLNAYEAARLAVMLPSPKFFETRQGSSYLARRASTIVARMGGIEAP